MEPYYQSHDKDGQFRCDHQNCNKFLCFQCMRESDEYTDLLPSKICYFCHDCIQRIRNEQDGGMCKPVAEKEKPITMEYNEMD